ncbi:SufE family protein [Terrihabitans rhizophilus]|jgi:cysteine desulfuration protein SufE|uniref:SufE family protein n=1 Tax=Terrihabitans rhizophilus TaxID=3092662 RepID=A0ABU4RPL4_9HYPH|nr:SufE family protein [Terrihabitans sp. PJ23]MDX6806546.1 SufE family protein [Terrihabitans sp. PJ23]
MTIDTIIESFGYLDDWEERYRYLIELGRDLPPFPDEARTAANKVEGCASQVWLLSRMQPSPEGSVLTFQGDSDAHIVKGLVALILAFYSGHTAREIATMDAGALLSDLGLSDHLTPQRSNGVRAMVQRIKAEAARALVTN